MNSTIENRKSKISGLPLKLAILVIVIFGLLVTGMVLWTPIKVRYYAAKLHSKDVKVRQHAAKILLDLDREKVFRYYTDRYDPNDVKRRMEVVEELCTCGNKGRAVMKEIFRNWVYGPTQQVKIPAGTLTLDNGSKVEIKSLWVDKYEVTLEKWWVYHRCIMPCNTPGFNEALGLDIYSVPEYPITSIKWTTAKEFAYWLGIRLPTEYEWEYAARAGSTGKYCFGDNYSMLGEYAWYKDNSGGSTHPVGQKRPNKWGLYDVHGNVWEWADWLRGKARIAFGGSYSGTRKPIGLDTAGPGLASYDTVGFRCVRDVK
jgi:hypothetical protein